MPSKFDELLDEMAEAEAVEPEWLDRLREASKGSPLRKERDTANERAERAEGRAAELEKRILTGTLEQLGVQVKLDHLRLPDELEVDDPEKVKAWAIEAGLIEAQPDVPPEEIDAQDRIAAASAGASGKEAGIITPTDAAAWAADQWARFAKAHPDKAEALKRGEEVTAVA